MSRALIAERTAAQERIRKERSALSTTLVDLAADVVRAKAAVESAEVAEVISPTSPQAAATAKAARAALNSAVEKRDAAEVRAEILDKADKRLAEELRDLDKVVRREEKAAAWTALQKRIDRDRPLAHEWIVCAVAAERLKGTVVTDAGLAAIQALEPAQNAQAVIGAVYARASAICEAVDRGEVLK